MTTISDYFDAMRTTRSYRPSRQKDLISASLVLLAGTEFHPFLARNMAKLAGTFEKESAGQGSAEPDTEDPA